MRRHERRSLVTPIRRRDNQLPATSPHQTEATVVRTTGEEVEGGVGEEGDTRTAAPRKTKPAAQLPASPPARRSFSIPATLQNQASASRSAVETPRPRAPPGLARHVWRTKLSEHLEDPIAAEEEALRGAGPRTFETSIYVRLPTTTNLPSQLDNSLGICYLVLPHVTDNLAVTCVH
jgi:hypothetical protein